MSNKFENILKPIKIGNVVLRNRILRPPSMPHFHQGPEKWYTDNLFAHYANTARAGAAIVTVSGVRQYQKTGTTQRFTQCNLYDPATQNTISHMADVIHLYGAKAGMLIPPAVREGYDVMEGIDNFVTAGDGTYLTDNQMLTPEMIKGIAEEYIESAVILKNCGFDMVWIHGTYQQFFLSRFLSPLLNKREDEYGGCLENRAKLALDVFKGIKERCGKDFLIEYSISPVEAEGGMTMDDTVAFLNLAKDYIDIVHPRTVDLESWNVVGIDCPEGFTQRKLARDLKERIQDTGILVETAGGYFDPDQCEEVLRDGDADFVGVGRGWFTNPDFLRIANEGRSDDIVPCITCNRCHVLGVNGPYLSVCSVNPRMGYENKESWLIQTPRAKRKVAVIGGGPAGMRSALFLSERGHEVTLYEKTDQLGGMLNNACFPDFKWPLRKYRDWLLYQISKHSEIKVILNTDVTKEMLLKQGYEDVIIAIGAEPLIPGNIKGIDLPNVIPAAYIYGQEDRLGDQVAVIGGGDIGVETGLYLTSLGKKVTVLEMTGELAADAPPVHYRIHLQERYAKDPLFSSIVNAKVIEINQDGIVYLDQSGKQQHLPATGVALAVGMIPRSEEAMRMMGAGYRSQMIGDCDYPSNIQKVTRSAFGAAMAVL